MLDVEFDASLIDNEEMLGKVAAHNALQNEMRSGTFNESITYLLPQVDENIVLEIHVYTSLSFSSMNRPPASEIFEDLALVLRLFRPVTAVAIRTARSRFSWRRSS